jgi:hypothetical protein
MDILKMSKMKNLEVLSPKKQYKPVGLHIRAIRRNFDVFFLTN